MTKIKTAKQLAGLTLQLTLASQEKYNCLAEARGLTQSELKCLLLFDYAKRLNNKEIANKMQLSEGRLTRIIDGLVKKEFMKRENNRKDRRALILSLTRKAKSFMLKMEEENVDLHRKILKDIDITHHKALIIAMENLHSDTEIWLSNQK